MTITDFNLTNALMGGVLIGLASVLLMFFLGRIAGISGVLSRLLSPTLASNWQWAFIAGLFLSGFIVHHFYAPITIQLESNTALLIISGLLVGFGTRLGAGCTSGHGVCGMSRLSIRSIVATLIFMTSAVITVFLMKQV